MNARRIVVGLLLVFAAVAGLRAADAMVAVGAARIDITPELPIQLAGYQQRITEAQRVEMPLTARALAIGSDAEGPVVMSIRAAPTATIASAARNPAAAAKTSSNPTTMRRAFTVWRACASPAAAATTRCGCPRHL